VAFTGSPAPFTNDWRRGSTVVDTHVLSNTVDFFTVTVPNVATTLQYRVYIKNLATFGGGVLSAAATLTVLADTNSNGLPDSWETTYGITDPNADADGDGMTNREEYQAGTNPTDPLSLLKVEISAAPDQVTLGFGAMSNLTYSLQHQPGLGGGAWTSLAEVLARKTNRDETFIHTNSTGAGFYRVVMPRQP